LINATWIKASFWTIRTGRTGRMIRVSFYSEVATVKEISSGTTHTVKKSTKPFTLEGVHVSIQGRTAHVRTSHWITRATSTWLGAHHRIVRLSVQIQPRYGAPGRRVTAPHGLLGQSYDGDSRPIFGRVDGDMLAPVPAMAQAEGFIEGKAHDYQLSQPFATEFHFNRFDCKPSKPRDANSLHLTSLQLIRNTTGVKLLVGANLVGLDLAGLRSARTVQDCARACSSHPLCVAFTFITAVGHARPCWLKRKGYHIDWVRGTVSGIVRRPG
jgi:hypothetical protein